MCPSDQVTALLWLSHLCSSSVHAHAFCPSCSVPPASDKMQALLVSHPPSILRLQEVAEIDLRAATIYRWTQKTAGVGQGAELSREENETQAQCANENLFLKPMFSC